MFRQVEDKQSRARVRVVGRALSDPSSTGVRRLLAAPGVELSLEEALSSGIPVGQLEAASPAAVAALAKLSGDGQKADVPTEPEEEEEADDGEVAWPKHRGGPYWELSDGSQFRGARDEASAAQTKLDG